ncbi:MAG: L-fuconolactonase [Cyclobacteriaceae bacterium]|jgi:L-fuconolactonase
MRIDSHHHFWKYDPVNYAWIDESMKVIRNDYVPEVLEPVLKSANIDGCVSVQADQTEAETNRLLNFAEKNDFIKGVVGWVDLRADNIEERLEHFSQYKLLKGMRHVVQGEPDDFMLGTEFQNGISHLHEYGMVYDILVFPTQLKASIALAEKFPDQPFVLDHIAKPYIKDKKIDGWAEEIKILAQSPNVQCKVSGMVTEADWTNWKEAEFTPYLDVIFEAFGVDRVMYGSDWPVCLVASEYNRMLSIVENYISKYSDADKAKVMGENAMSFYSL